MEIILLRHGIAIDAADAGGIDEARTLSREGRKKVAEGAKTIRKLGIKPTHIVTSPLPRASETAQITARALGCAKLVTLAPTLASGASPEDYAKALRGIAGDAKVMMVGHNPDMEKFLAWLVSPQASARAELKKGGLAIIEVGKAGGKSPKKLAKPGRGILKALYPARDLGKLAH